MTTVKPAYTHIRLTVPTRDMLRGLKKGNEEYEDVIRRLIKQGEALANAYAQE